MLLRHARHQNELLNICRQFCRVVRRFGVGVCLFILQHLRVINVLYVYYTYIYNRRPWRNFDHFTQHCIRTHGYKTKVCNPYMTT